MCARPSTVRPSGPAAATKASAMAMPYAPPSSSTYTLRACSWSCTNRAATPPCTSSAIVTRGGAAGDATTAASGVGGAAGGGAGGTATAGDAVDAAGAGEGDAIAGMKCAVTAGALVRRRWIPAANLSGAVSASAVWSRTASDAAVGPSEEPSLLAPITAKFEGCICSASPLSPADDEAAGVRNTSNRTRPVLSLPRTRLSTRLLAIMPCVRTS